MSITNINITPEVLERIAVQGLRLDPPPTEDETDWLLTRLATAFECGPDDVAQARKSLLARFYNRMVLHRTSED